MTRLTSYSTMQTCFDAPQLLPIPSSDIIIIRLPWQQSERFVMGQQPDWL
jgi:hypothetical protein